MKNYTISDNGINFIANFEGLRTKAYKCPAGIWTLGVGETGIFALTGQRIQSGLTCTEKQAKESFRIAIKRYITAVNRLDVELNQNQADALISFCYNLGTGIFTGTLLTSIKKKDWNDVARQIKLYNKARVKGKLTVLKGLDTRRKAEAELLLKPVENSNTDEDLFNAVSMLIKKGIKIDFNAWKRLDSIQKNMKNVPILLERLGGLDKLIDKKVISDKKIWEQKQYNEKHVKSLLIKASKLL